MTLRDFCIYLMDNTANELTRKENQHKTAYKDRLFTEHGKLDKAVIQLEEDIPVTKETVYKLKNEFDIDIDDRFYQSFIVNKLGDNIHTLSRLEYENKILGTLLKIV